MQVVKVQIYRCVDAVIT